MALGDVPRASLPTGYQCCVSVSGQLICRLAEAAADATDPEDALQTITLLRREVDEFERQQVARALTAGRSFNKIARSLGVSRQAVHKRYRHLNQRGQASGIPPSPELRLVIEYAKEEASALGSPAVGAPHLLLGILRNGDRRGAAALTYAGADLDVLRRHARCQAPGDLRAVLADSAGHAHRAGGDQIRAEHVLRAALADGGATRELLDRIGVSPAGVLESLERLPADDSGCRGG